MGLLTNLLALGEMLRIKEHKNFVAYNRGTKGFYSCFMGKSKRFKKNQRKGL